MEEVIVRHYFNNIQALVYLGAVLLLTSLGLRFAGLLSERIALIGIGSSVIFPLAMSAAAQRTDRPASVNVASLGQMTFVVFFAIDPVTQLLDSITG